MRRIAGRWPLTPLAGLLLALLVMGDVPVAHLHDHPGYYDLECPLARLGVAAPRLALSSVPVLAPLDGTPEPAPACEVEACPEVRRASFESRAPPTVSAPSVRALMA